ncbi:hypothetical protein PR048_027763 [Dryococelus australis]|uniref:Uncharacterized protein n=1 Tax=Dryococelus australis TaxID=614101 RepID=A0ABQ9GHD1_9NEOP|nr:hypothetical protein PR048_027763 [Dryococelus australis]
MLVSLCSEILALGLGFDQKHCKQNLFTMKQKLPIAVVNSIKSALENLLKHRRIKTFAKEMLTTMNL